MSINECDILIVMLSSIMYGDFFKDAAEIYAKHISFKILINCSTAIFIFMLFFYLHDISFIKISVTMR